MTYLVLLEVPERVESCERGLRHVRILAQSRQLLQLFIVQLVRKAVVLVSEHLLLLVKPLALVA